MTPEERMSELMVGVLELRFPDAQGVDWAEVIRVVSGFGALVTSERRPLKRPRLPAPVAARLTNGVEHDSGQPSDIHAVKERTKEALRAALAKGPIRLADFYDVGVSRSTLGVWAQALGARPSGVTSDATWSLTKRAKWEQAVDDSSIPDEAIEKAVREALADGPVKMFDLMARTKANRERIADVLKAIGARANGRHRGATWSLGKRRVGSKQQAAAEPSIRALLKEGPQSLKALMAASGASDGVVRGLLERIGAIRSGYTTNQRFSLPPEDK